MMKYTTRQRVIRFLAIVAAVVLLKVFYIDSTYCPSMVMNSELQHIRASNMQQHTRESDSKKNERMSKMTNLFEGTLRNCLGGNCFDMKAGDIDRIGLLAPPSSGAETIISTITALGVPLATETYNIISSTNVPAYGYGKNHGWSRIIRLVRRPIPHALSILIPTGKLSSTIGAMLYEAQVRQLLRWHCRLSHVAAHTKMLTVFVDDLILRPVVELEKIMTFAGVALPGRKTIARAGLTLQRELRDAFSIYENLTYVASAVERVVIDAGVDALEEELKETEMLSAWPCRSFRALGAVSNEMPISAERLAANCSDKFVTCSVKFDAEGG